MPEGTKVKRGAIRERGLRKSSECPPFNGECVSREGSVPGPGMYGMGLMPEHNVVFSVGRQGGREDQPHGG